jgi:hypothetical protein
MVKQRTGLNDKPRAGFLKGQGVQDIINKVWFKSSKGRIDADTLREVYERFPLAAIALVLTAVRP